MRLDLSIVLSTLAAGTLLSLGTARAAGVPGQGTWEATLQPRDINGDGTVDAFYDTLLNVSWLADANASAGNVYYGRMNWGNANAWAANLNVYGTTGWRLPTMIDTSAPGCDGSYAGGTDCGYNVQTISQDGKTVFSEMAHLYYVSLGNKAYCNPIGSTVTSCVEQQGWGLTNTGDFRNMQASVYWSDVVYSPYPGMAWYFILQTGYQIAVDHGNILYSLAVHPGDVTAAVPEPQTCALLLVGVAGVLVAVRRQSI